MANHPNRSQATKRNAVRAMLERSREYDASTMRLAPDGSVTALKDADKTFAGYNPTRYLVGHIDDLLADAAAGHC